MYEFQDRQKLKRRIYSRPTLALLAVVAVLAAKGTWNVYWKNAESETNLREVEARYAALQAREGKLTREIERLGTEKGMEEEARKKFSVVKDGEQMIVLVDPEKAPEPAPAPKRGFLGRMWDSVTSPFR